MRTFRESQGTIELRGEKITYCYITSSRRSLAIQIKEGQVIVRAPYGLSQKDSERFLIERQNWILQKLRESKNLTDALKKSAPDSGYTKLQEEALEKRYRELAREYLEKRVLFYQSKTGGIYTSITIRSQKTRWGSCSSRGTLSFNWRLILAPPLILDYVVVHELCHLKHMDHSPAFWNAVAQVMPDYKIRRKWLKQHSRELSETFEPVPYSNVI